MGNINPYK
jgi:hypothetical protein